MTAFKHKNFVNNKGWVTYNAGEPTAPNYKFAFRFKYGGKGIPDFRRFLVANFTVEEYFSRLEAGEAPLAILESKGYVLPHIRQDLEAKGYPVTPAGFRQMIKDRSSLANPERRSLIIV